MVKEPIEQMQVAQGRENKTQCLGSYGVATTNEQVTSNCDHCGFIFFPAETTPLVTNAEERGEVQILRVLVLTK